MLGGMLVGAAHGREPRNVFALELVAHHRAVAEAQRERRIRRDAQSFLREQCLADVAAALAQGSGLDPDGDVTWERILEVTGG